MLDWFEKTLVSKSLSVKTLERERHWLTGGLIGLEKHLKESFTLRNWRKRLWLTGEEKFLKRLGAGKIVRDTSWATH